MVEMVWCACVVKMVWWRWSGGRRCGVDVVGDGMRVVWLRWCGGDGLVEMVLSRLCGGWCGGDGLVEMVWCRWHGGDAVVEMVWWRWCGGNEQIARLWMPKIEKPPDSDR